MPQLRARVTSGLEPRKAADEREVVHELDSNLTAAYAAGTDR
jgi:hypothetical protein